MRQEIARAGLAAVAIGFGAACGKNIEPVRHILPRTATLEPVVAPPPQKASYNPSPWSDPSMYFIHEPYYQQWRNSLPASHTVEVHNYEFGGPHVQGCVVKPPFTARELPELQSVQKEVFPGIALEPECIYWQAELVIKDAIDGTVKSRWGVWYSNSNIGQIDLNYNPNSFVLIENEGQTVVNTVRHVQPQVTIWERQP